MEIRFEVSEHSPMLLWQQVKAQIKNFITSNKVPVGTRLPNVKDLAKQANVSLKTAEHALQALIREEVCFRLPKRGTFVGSGYAVPAVRRVCGLYHYLHYKTVCHDQLLGRVFLGIQRESCNTCDTVFFQDALEDSIHRYLGQTHLKLCGIIILFPMDCDAATRLACKFPELRFVFVNYRFKDFEETPKNIFGVFNDDFGGAYQQATYLAGREFRHFATVSLPEPNVLCYEYRLEGFAAGLKSCGIVIAPEKQVMVTPEEPIEQCEDLFRLGRIGVTEILRGGKVPEVIFTPNDYLSEGVLRELEQRGLASEVTVVGYDGIIARQVAFTTVCIDFERMGQIAVRLLTDPKQYSPKITLVQPQLLIKNKDNDSRQL